MAYPDAALERAMTVQEVMLKALSGELHWFRAADILGWSPRTLRRLVHLVLVRKTVSQACAESGW